MCGEQESRWQSEMRWYEFNIHYHEILHCTSTRAVKTDGAVRSGPFSPINYRVWALNSEPEFFLARP